MIFICEKHQFVGTSYIDQLVSGKRHCEILICPEGHKVTDPS